jgi:hypothetical protein
MSNDQPDPGAVKAVTTTKGTVATYNLADMHRVFQYIEADDLVALDKLMLSGRAFHLPKGVEVYVLDAGPGKEGICKLRIKGSITEMWASVRATTEP